MSIKATKKNLEEFLNILSLLETAWYILCVNWIQQNKYIIFLEIKLAVIKSYCHFYELF